ncbi:MAG: hypothetical protein LBN37_02860 [Bacteroidales bacterium]|jgi:hypothetical protein|nr:hypothetical protein [Bacteroidales bacterium]
MIRSVLVPDSAEVLLSIPEEYVGKKVEITAFPIIDTVVRQERRKKVTFNSISIDTVGFKFNRDEANER